MLWFDKLTGKKNKAVVINEPVSLLLKALQDYGECSLNE